MKNLRAFLFLLLVSTKIFAQVSWYIVPGTPTNNWRFDDISFCNDSVGWTGQDGIIYKTTDRGNTWNVTDTFEVGAYIRSIEFINDSVGFVGTLAGASSAHLYQTRNGGNSFVNIDSTISSVSGLV